MQLTGIPALDTLLMLMLGLGILLGALFVTVVTFGPVAKSIRARVEEMLAPKVDAAVQAAQTTSKQTTEQWLADFGREQFEQLNATVEQLKADLKIEQDKGAAAEQATALRISEHKTETSLLQGQIAELKGVIDSMKQQNMTTARERDEANHEVKRVSGELKKAQDKIHDLEVQVARLQGSEQTLNRVLDKIQVVNVVSDNGAAPSSTELKEEK